MTGEIGFSISPKEVCRAFSTAGELLKIGAREAR
jgi:hypothetical protein